ncbi:DUF4062 domain-containing protein [uncultured Methanobacterium sp.]|uniref:DUF4062 domain-containing protein n=1 Tax=uncultured Methanobacterium sp. TaxID=176306 RepID=UPI002AA8F068|nr:DUF4062 domain-containing protein [uncultured Methanobacterium sp.]
MFVSSTFSDMKEERNALQRKVFPKLRKLCMEHGFRFQAIDLRWGVSEEAGLDQQTMKICLEEIERSQRVSPKPNFIVLLGDRYGWKPLPYEIPADEFEEIKKVVSPSDKEFLFWEGDVLEDDQLKKRDGWYCRDENAVPPVYCLKPRFVDYDEDDYDEEIKKARDLEYKEWEDVEKRLKTILLNAIDKLGWDKDDSRRFKYESSATEQEIIKGVLNLPEDGSLSEKHVFSFMRTIKGKKGIPFDDHSKDFFDFTAAGTIDASAEEKLFALKDKIDDKLPSSNIFDYETKWERKGVNNLHIKNLCKDVYYSLEKVIMEQVNEFKEVSTLKWEINTHINHGKKMTEIFVGQKEILQRISDYIEIQNTQPLVIYGESGFGKSTVIAKAYENSKFRKRHIILRFIGATPNSMNHFFLLKSLCEEITKFYGADKTLIDQSNDLEFEFRRCIALANKEKQLVIFIDDIDLLTDQGLHEINYWLPERLPNYVKIIVSTSDKNWLFQARQKISHNNLIYLKKMEKKDGIKILEAWLSKNGRTLKKSQFKELINNFCLNGFPLYLKIAFEEAKLWKSYHQISLPKDIKFLIKNFLTRISNPSNHGNILVRKSLCYLASSRRGLSEDEIIGLLSIDDEFYQYFLKNSKHEINEKKIPIVLWIRLYHDLKPFLLEKTEDNNILFAFYQNIFFDVIEEEFLKNENTEYNQKIIEYFKIMPNSSSYNKPNLRKISELPYQLVLTRKWKDLSNLLANLEFLSNILEINDYEVYKLWRKIEENSIFTISKTYEYVFQNMNLYLNYLPVLSHFLSETDHYDESFWISDYILKSNMDVNTHNLDEIAFIFNLQAMLFYNRGSEQDFEIAMILLRNAEGIYRSLGDIRNLSSVLNNQATILSSVGLIDDAEQIIDEQIDLCKNINNIISSNLLGNKAVILKEKGYLDDALELHEKEEEICNKIGDLNGLQICLGNQANLLIEKKLNNKAMKLLIRQEEICRSLNKCSSLSNCISNQAFLFFSEKKYENALYLIQKQKKIAIKIKSEKQLMIAKSSEQIIIDMIGSNEAKY